MVTIHVIVRGTRAFVRRRARGETRRTLSTRAAGQIVVASVAFAIACAASCGVTRRVERVSGTSSALMVTIHVIVRGARAFVRRRARGETRRTLSTRAAGQIVASVAFASACATSCGVARRVERVSGTSSALMVTIHVIVRGTRAFVRRRARGETRRTLSTRAAGQIVASITLALGLAPGWDVARRVRREPDGHATHVTGTVHAIVRGASALRLARGRASPARSTSQDGDATTRTVHCSRTDSSAEAQVALGLARGWDVTRRVRRARWTRHTRTGTVHAIVRGARHCVSPRMGSPARSTSQMDTPARTCTVTDR